MSDDVRAAERGRLAEQVLENPVYVEAYESVEKELIRQWRDSRDRDAREQKHQMLTMLDTVRTVMQATMRSGQVAVKELERKQSLAQRLGSRFRGD